MNRQANKRAGVTDESAAVGGKLGTEDATGQAEVVK